MAAKRAKLREQIRAADDLDRMCPVGDLFDAVDLVVVTKKRLMDHFVAVAKQQISLRQLMDMCLDAPVEGRDWMSPPLLRVCGIGKIGFRSVVNGLTGTDMGYRCNEEWQMRLVRVKQEHGVTKATPHSSRA
jgi:hypothetical protein